MIRRLDARSAKEADYGAAVARGEFSNEWVDDLPLQNGLAPPTLETAG
jgi:hypothetical protein